MDASKFSDLMLGRRYGPRMRLALYAVLVDGRSQTDAASGNGLSRQQVSISLRHLRLREAMMIQNNEAREKWNR